MKKTVFLTALLTVAVAFSSFSNDNVPGPIPGNPNAVIKSLTVNADVTIVLINGDNQQASMVGDPSFMEQVSFRQNGNSLVVKASKDRNFKGKGIIYVPAAKLNYIKVNSAAHIKSAGILDIPDLKVHVNGHCRLHVITTGKVSPESNSYEIEYYARNLFETDPYASN